MLTQVGLAQIPRGAALRCRGVVAVDDTGRPVKIPALIPETELEKERFDGALRRKQLSLVLAGKMKPEDATELGLAKQ